MELRLWASTPGTAFVQVKSWRATELGEDFIALDDALERLAAVDARKGRLVELRFFGGLSVEETAEVLKVSPRTVMRDWSLAQAWLYRELRGTKSDDT